MVNWLTGEITFTETEIVFTSDIKKWENKDIVFSYSGYGGMPITEIVFEDGVPKFKDKFHKMDWENKGYDARILNISRNFMRIELLENGYQFDLSASDFRNSEKYDFDIGVKDK